MLLDSFGTDTIFEGIFLPTKRLIMYAKYSILNEKQAPYDKKTERMQVHELDNNSLVLSR